MSNTAGSILKKMINTPLNMMGLALVKSGNKQAHILPTWMERMQLAKKLGFSPQVIVDGGGFRGIWSKDVAGLFPGAQIIIVEPNPFVLPYIENNVGHIQPPPQILKMALGELPGNTILHFWHEEGADASASLLNHVSGPAHKEIEVKVETLDNISQQTRLMPDFIKLDLQGGELSALKGATEVLKHAEFMMIEFGCLDAYLGRTTPRDLLDMMYDNDYCLYDIVDCHYRPYDGALTGGDFFFIKNSSILRKYKGWE